jgi:hypothetical protein
LIDPAIDDLRKQFTEIGKLHAFTPAVVQRDNAIRSRRA